MKINELKAEKTTLKFLKEYIKSKDYSLDRPFIYYNNLYVYSKKYSYYNIIDLSNGNIINTIETDSSDPYGILNQIYGSNNWNINEYYEVNSSKNEIKYRPYTKDSFCKKKKISNEKWDAMSDYIFNMAIIYKDNRYGVIDEEYNIILDLNDKYDNIKLLPNYLIFLTDKNGNNALYSKNDGFIINFDKNIKYDDIALVGKNIDDNFYAIKNEKYGLIDKCGNIKLKCEYDLIPINNILNKNFIIACKGDTTEFYDNNFNMKCVLYGKVVIFDKFMLSEYENKYSVFCFLCKLF